MNFELRTLTSEKKWLVSFFVVALLIGYGVSLLKAADQSAFSSAKIVRQYRGDPDPDAMAFPKPYEDILQNTHAHALSVPVVYFLLAALFSGSSARARLKKVCFAALFGGFFLEFAALWGLRYIHEDCVYIMFAAHAISGPAYLFMCSRIFWDLRSV